VDDWAPLQHRADLAQGRIQLQLERWHIVDRLSWLTDAQMARLEPFFPKSHGKPRVDDWRVLSQRLAMVRCRLGIRSTQDPL